MNQNRKLPTFRPLAATACAAVGDGARTFERGCKRLCTPEIVPCAGGDGHPGTLNSRPFRPVRPEWGSETSIRPTSRLVALPRHAWSCLRTDARRLLPAASRRMIWSDVCRRSLFDAMSSLILPAPTPGNRAAQPSGPTTTGSPRINASFGCLDRCSEQALNTMRCRSTTGQWSRGPDHPPRSAAAAQERPGTDPFSG